MVYLGVEEYDQIIGAWNDTERAYASDKPLQSLFEEQVLRTPDNIALVYEEVELTYRELNERSNRVAWWLRGSYGVGADVLVGLCMDRSEEMLIAILGVLKAGGAYVPLDPGYPGERVRYMASDTGARVLLT